MESKLYRIREFVNPKDNHSLIVDTSNGMSLGALPGLEQFAAAVRAAPDDARWQVGLGLVALGQRDAEPAERLLREAAELAPDEASPRAYLAAA